MPLKLTIEAEEEETMIQQNYTPQLTTARLIHFKEGFYKTNPAGTPVIEKPEQDKNMTTSMPERGHQKKRKADWSPDVEHMDEMQSATLCKLKN